MPVADVGDGRLRRAIESGVEPPQAEGAARARPGGDPGGVDAAEADTLFDLHIRYLIEGIARDTAAAAAPGGTAR